MGGTAHLADGSYIQRKPRHGQAGRRIELTLWNDLLGLARAGPRKARRCVTRIIVVLHPNLILLASNERDRAAPFRRPLVNPLIDDQLAVHPEPHAVVGARIERVRLRIERLDLSNPAHTEGVRAQAGGWSSRSP